ncbi:MAG: hypothetical protein JWN57_1571 [Frankiales bacterium]|nr:hypothetical protein [Frankiales bacterium]
MTAVPRRLAAVFLTAALGVLVLLGAVAWRVGGPVALAAYAVVVLGLLAVLTTRARALVAAGRERAGHTCRCCTSSQHDPVQVV